MENNHGSYAKAGDFVEAINPMGEPTGLHGVVVGEFVQPGIVSRRFRPERILKVLVTWSTGAEVEHMKDSFVRIVGKA